MIVPREFVFMDRAAVGLGAVFLHLNAELNYHRLFEAEIERFSLETLASSKARALKRPCRASDESGVATGQRCSGAYSR